MKDELNTLAEVQSAGALAIAFFDINGRKVVAMNKVNISKNHKIITLRSLKTASGEYIISIRAGNVKRNEKVVFE